MTAELLPDDPNAEYVLAELARVAEDIRAVEAQRAELFDRRAMLYAMGAELNVSTRRMAKAAQVSSGALVLAHGRRSTKAS